MVGGRALERERHVAFQQVRSVLVVVEPIAPPVPINDGPNKGRRVVYLRDPDGVTIEFIEIPGAKR